MLTCYRTRRRIGAYLDDALGQRQSARASAHISACARCHAEVESLTRLSLRLRSSAPSPELPDWTGFWEGIRRGIDGPRIDVQAHARWRPRLVMGTAGALALAASLIVVWQAPWGPLAPHPAAAITVSSADTDHPGGAVMVYSPPERDLAVIWLIAAADD